MMNLTSGPLDTYGHFKNFAKHQENGEIFKEIASACKKQTKGSKRSADWERKQIIQNLYAVLKENLGVYKYIQISKQGHSFTLDLPFYTEEQNECIKRLVVDAFKAANFETVETSDAAGFLKLQVKINSVIGK